MKILIYVHLSITGNMDYLIKAMRLNEIIKEISVENGGG